MQPRHSCALLVVLVLGAAWTARAQALADPAAPACPVTDVAHAARSGVSAAGRPIVLGYAIAAFAAGVPAGFMLPLVIGERGLDVDPGDPETQIFALGAAGVGATAAAAGRRAVVPGIQSELVRGCVPELRAAFDDAYVRRVRQRRVRAALVGGGTGALAGAGFLFFVLTQLGGS